MIIKIKQVGNHFYPCINHDFGYNISLCRNTERWFRMWNKHKVIRPDEVEIEFEEIGYVCNEIECTIGKTHHNGYHHHHHH